MGVKSRQILCVVSLLLWAFVASFASDETIAEHDNSRISIFVQPSISFLSFDQRDYFQDAVDTIYKEFRANALDESESLNVAKQNFQKVNFCFPVYGGLQFQLLDDQFLSAGIGYIYDNESVVLSDRKSKSHNYSYTIQGVPLFLEYRLAIPLNLMTLSDGGLFSVALRWYWTLPGTEIYTTWGKIGAENSPYGAGFGISIGYLIASWHGINVFGDIGYSSISVESKKSFADIVPDGPEEKAKWNIGGLQLQIRVGFGIWNKPKPVDPADSLKAGNPLNRAGHATQDSLTAMADSTITDSLGTVQASTDSAVADTAIVDSSTAASSIADTSTADTSTVAPAADSSVQPMTTEDSAEAATAAKSAPVAETKSTENSAPATQMQTEEKATEQASTARQSEKSTPTQATETKAEPVKK